ncbi:MAG: peptidoglycan DD-metalloendopeptidase family protein, partial [Acutalibacteraceae bacterium]|nr:peptidoglycan DD-metalloendopeptidase family protein [Acutalibacteraceae bacterium]
HRKAKKVHKAEKKATKLTKQQNKLKTKESKLKQSKKFNKSKKTTKKASNTTKKMVQKIEKAIFDFAKFAFKGLGTILAPMLIVIIVFALILMMFAGTSSRSTYLLATYNCVDSDIGKAIDAYTKVAYEFNEKVIKCQSSSSWKSGLRDFGVNTWSYDDTPTEFVFGRSYKFNYDPVYDFDYNKLVAFMCAYTYPFASDDVTVSDNEDVEKWTYRAGYDSVLKDLFNAEYQFQHEYINTSHWVPLYSYTIYPSNSSLYFVNGSGTTTISGMTYGFLEFTTHSGVPSELQPFTSDGAIHFDLSTGEVRNRTKSYGKTGYFIQNLNYQYTDSSGGVLNSFYTWYSYASGSYFGFFADGMEQRKTQLYVNGMEFNYVVAKEDARKYTGNYSENRQLMRFYRGEEYITECKLYTNVKQLRTFDEAIRYVLSNQEYSASRLEFYNTLLNGEVPTYGNHQTYQSPLPSSFSSIIEGNKIYNGYGYDMRAWNTVHCSLEKHHGLDITAPTGTNVLAMISGKVDSIDTSKHTITLYSDNITYWYDKNKKRKTEINYVNVNVSSSLNVGDVVNVGDVIGTVSNYKHCNGDFENSSATNNYLHISVQINYGNAISADWCDVDPRFLIYLS